MKTRRACLGSIAGMAALFFPPAGRAEAWPSKPVKIIVPFGAGGNTDIVARIIAQPLSDVFGQQFVIDNRPGAAGALGADAVARAPADGYTLLMASLPQLAIVPAMSKTPYDPIRDFAPISNVGTNPFVLTVRGNPPISTVAEFIAYARQQPNKLTYVATGVGSLNHLTMALFLHRAGFQMIPVMYKGGPVGLTDLIGGHVDAYFASLSHVAPHATNAALRFLAITSEQRAPQLPAVPTFAEAGFPGFSSVLWTGLLAPTGTPKEIVQRIAAETSRLVKDPSVRERLAGNGIDPLGNTPAEFAAMIAADVAFWAEAVKVTGVQER